MSDDAFDIVIVQVEAAQRGRASIWTVYSWPKDYPTGFVARMFEVTAAGPQPTPYAIRCMDLEPIREKLFRAVSLAGHATTATSRKLSKAGHSGDCSNPDRGVGDGDAIRDSLTS
jgi:hypothetical protein